MAETWLPVDAAEYEERQARLRARMGLAVVRGGANERELAATVFPARTLAGSHFVPSDVHHGRFAPRCVHAVARCRSEDPRLRPIEPSHEAACHEIEAIRQRGER